MALILVDTNVLLYAHDLSDEEKQARALDVLNEVSASGHGRLTTQVLGEFFSVATRGRAPLLDTAEAVSQMQRLLIGWRVLDVTAMVVAEAVRGVATHQLPYWDAQLWAAARLNQIPVIFSEDFNSGATLEGVRFVNPLLDDFDVAAWL